MRAATARRARADRPPRPDPLHHRCGQAHEPRRGVPPRRQPLPALRAPQPARAQLAFNDNGIGTYTEQRRLRAFGRPFPAALSKHVGRAVDFQDHPNRKPAVLAVTPPLTPGLPIPPRWTVLSPRDAPQPRRAHPESRSTPPHRRRRSSGRTNLPTTQLLSDLPHRQRPHRNLRRLHLK